MGPQELRRRRAKQKKLIKLVVEAAHKQTNRLLGETTSLLNPRNSELWDQPDMKDLLNDPVFKEVKFDMRSFDLRACSDGGLLKKPTKVMCTNDAYVDFLARPFSGS